MVEYLPFILMLAIALALALRPGERSSLSGVGRAVVDGIIIVVAWNSGFPWYGQLAIFLGLMFVTHASIGGFRRYWNVNRKFGGD